MNKTLDSWIEAHSDEIVQALQQSVRIQSVMSPASAPNAPFGKGCRDALDYTLKLCERLGFETCDLDGYVGYADYGENEELLAILSHLDVVPAGEGWSRDPFGGEIADGRIIGRGTMDNKGPGIASIYALAAVKAAGLPLRRKVRLIFGCNEESGMKCMDYYRAHAQLPDIAFTPDAAYPIVQSEKNILHATFSRAFSSKVTLQAGTAANVVPGKAVATLPLALDVVEPVCRQFAEEYGFGWACEAVNEGTQVTLTGVWAHGAMPETGKNAMQGMLMLLARLPLEGEDAAAAGSLAQSFAMEYHGERLGLDITDESGRLTLNMGVMDWNHDGVSVTLDIRHPISLDADRVLAALDGAFGKIDAQRTYVYRDKGLFVPSDSELFRALMGVFEARFGKGHEPLHIGGGTYARRYENAAAFGPALSTRENRVHMADESFAISDLILDTKVIADAIVELAVQK